MERILLVDDNNAVRKLAREMIAGEGYDVADVGSAAEALAWARQHEPFDVLITDLVMPDLDGLDLAVAMRGINPSVRVLYTSGYADMSWTGNFLAKPYARAALSKAIDELVAA
jgi:two-component system, cell cycle sensor histidine kinase and response regulator CckA